MLLDIVILPPESWRKKFGSGVKKAAGDAPANIVVDNIRCTPHLSLWHIKTEKDKIPQLGAALEEALSKEKPVRITSGDLKISDMQKGGSIISIEVKRSKPLATLQKVIFRSTHTFKTGMMPQSFNPWKGERLVQAKRYGRPTDFTPHFTMAWLKRETDVQRFVKDVKVPAVNFVANEVYICEIDKYWQVIKVIKKVRLGK